LGFIGGQIWFVGDCVRAAQFKAKNLSAGCGGKKAANEDFWRLLHMLCDTTSAFWSEIGDIHGRLIEVY
jgi:hypothetical protein